MEFLSKFNIIIFYIPDRENKKADLFTCQSNDCLANDYDNWQ